jgi:hypothetical protein
MLHNRVVFFYLSFYDLLSKLFAVLLMFRSLTGCSDFQIAVMGSHALSVETRNGFKGKFSAFCGGEFMIIVP